MVIEILNLSSYGDERVDAGLRSVLALTGARTAAIHLCDGRKTERRIRVLQTYGLDPEITSRYSAGIFRADPFNSEAVLASASRTGRTEYLSGRDRRIRAADRSYWSFMRSISSPAVGAAIRPIAPQQFLMVGLHGPLGWNAEIDDTSHRALEAFADAWMARLLERLLAAPAAQLYFDEMLGRGADRAPLERVREEDRQIVDLIGQGAFNKQIAAQLSLTETAVENRLRRLFRIFDVRTRTELAAKLRAFCGGAGSDCE